jgi:hypothetical protein
MTYVTLVYLTRDSEDVTRRVVQLVATPLKSFDFTKFKIEESFFRKLISLTRRVYLYKIREHVE